MWFVKKYWTFASSKKNFLCVCMYKMVGVGKETYENDNIKAIIDGTGALWLNEKHIEEK